MKTNKNLIGNGYSNRNKYEALLFTELRERFCINKLFETFNKKFGYKRFEFSTTLTNSGTVYDGILKVYDKNGIVIGYSIIEVKVREDSYSNYFLEKKKKDNLLKEKIKFDEQLRVIGEKIKCDILYINFTNTSTLIWDITYLEEIGKLKRGTRLEMNNITIENNNKKKLKSVYLLEIYDGKFITDFIFENKKFKYYYEELYSNNNKLNKVNKYF